MVRGKSKDSKEAFKDWYLANHEDFNAGRRYRYAHDAEYRSKQIENGRVQALGVRQSSGPEFKEFNGHEVLVYSSPQVALKLGVTNKTVVLWRKREHTPPTLKSPGGHAYYTPHQVDLMVKLRDILGNYPPRSREKFVRLAELKEVFDVEWKRGLGGLL